MKRKQPLTDCRLWTYDDVATFLGLSRKTIINKVSRGEIPYLRISPRVTRFSENEIREFFAR